MRNELDVIRHLFAELCSSQTNPFPQARAPIEAPESNGVYVIYNPSGDVVHVGRTKSARYGIAQRLRDHLSGSSSFKAHFLNGNGSLLRGGYTFKCVVVTNDRLRALLEAYAVGNLCPKHIGLG